MKPTNVFSKIAVLYAKKVRYIVNQGGTSSSKTYSTMQFLLFLLLSSKKHIKITVVSQTYGHLLDGVIYDFKNICIQNDINFYDYYNKTNHVFFINGSEMQFLSLDKPSKALGARRDILFINECNYIPFEVFENLEVRTKGTIFLDFNPVARFWVHNEILPRDNAELIMSTYLDNLDNLHENIISSIEAKKHKKNWWKIYGLGEIGFSEDLIFQEHNLLFYGEKIDVFNVQKVCFVDTADKGKDYFCAVFGAIINGSVYIFDVIYNQNLLISNEKYLIEKVNEYDVDFLCIETNKEGTYFLETLKKNVKSKLFGFFSTQNKESRILARAGFIVDDFVFMKNREKNTEYYNYFESLISFSMTGKNKNDDAPDATAGLAKFITVNKKLFRI